MEFLNTSTARRELPTLLASWRNSPGRPTYIGPYQTPEAILVPIEVWRSIRSKLPDRFPFAHQDRDGRMNQVTASEARKDIFRLLSEWRSGTGIPIMIERYGKPGAVLSPISVWHRMQSAIADSWDAETAAARQERLSDPKGVHSINVPHLALTAGCEQPSIPVLQSRGVPRGGASLAVWSEAITDLQTIATSVGPGQAVAALQSLCMILLGKAKVVESRCGNGAAYTAEDVDGLNLVMVTTRVSSRPPGRRGNGGHETVELIAVDHLSW